MKISGTCYRFDNIPFVKAIQLVFRQLIPQNNVRHVSLPFLPRPGETPHNPLLNVYNMASTRGKRQKGLSEYNSITFSILGSPYKRRESHKLYYSYANANWAKLRDLLCYIPWHCAFLDDDIDNNWTAWSDLLFTAIDECIPKRKKSARRHAPWITNDLIKLCRRKKSLYKKAKKWGRVNDSTEYCALNNSLKKPCNSARRQHIQNIAQDLQIHGNPKSFWSYVNSIRKGTNDLVALKENNITLMDDLSIAESMNSYFSAVFTSESFTNFPVFNNVVNSKLLSIVGNANEISGILKNLMRISPLGRIIYHHAS